MYEVDCQYGYKSFVCSNEVMTNMFAQVDENGNCYILFQSIVQYHGYETEVTKDEGFYCVSFQWNKKKRTKKRVGNYFNVGG